MSESEVFLRNLLCCIGFGIAGFLFRMALESWRDYHVAKALHEAGMRQEEQPQRRYRRAERHTAKRKMTLPKDILEAIKEGLQEGKKAKAERRDGQWRMIA